ncbi:Protein kinase domain-containing protein [Mycena indigotica]|uniref:Protein kinase domain-containing protein n=1 Tax=Mycena indigotica TaxID=2126181 RepID=A0A8H6VZ01_9AGAR|nr:Protein kinase domain-containing protein [Mycena indigotica]KAF7295458.1 Protein kinase domain-containing protein [Mycena indigotica]
MTLELLEDALDNVLETLEQMPSMVSQIIADITRYGPPLPSFPDVHLPGHLGDFEIPPPPPPPPPPTFIENAASWVHDNPRQLAGGLLGTGLVLYGAAYMHKSRAWKLLKEKATAERRQVVVVLGGDVPLALPLILDLERKGFIVITSVKTADLGADLERRGKGYVRAIVLDPTDPSTVTTFLRSLSAALSRRFPITSAGDPFVSPSSHPYICSVISLLSLAPPPVHAPLEHISLRSAYLPYLTATHIVPLQVIQALLPMLRTGPSRISKKSIVVCLPATAARVGLPFNAMQSMSVASTSRAVEVLRREVRIAALTDKSEAMKNIRVVVADVGAFNIGPLDTFLPPGEVYRAMEGWSSSEKLTYGPSFASLSHSVADESNSAWFDDNQSYRAPRKPTDVSVFVNSIVGTVSNGRFGLGLGIGRLQNWLRGDRFSIGAGAGTYKFASFLPPVLLDALINIPHILIGIRNALLPAQPFVRPPRNLPAVEKLQAGAAAKAQRQTESSSDASLSEHEHETGSEADVESNSGIDSASWVSLNKSTADDASEYSYQSILQPSSATALQNYITLRLLALKSNPEAFGSVYAHEKLNTTEKWRMRIDNPGRMTFIASVGSGDEGEWVGTASIISPELAGEGDNYHLVGMWVHPEHRRKGGCVGKSLVGNAIEWVRSRKVAGENEPQTRIISLEVHRPNVGAKAMYEGLGFVEAVEEKCQDPNRVPMLLELNAECK